MLLHMVTDDEGSKYLVVNAETSLQATRTVTAHSGVTTTVAYAEPVTAGSFVKLQAAPYAGESSFTVLEAVASEEGDPPAFLERFDNDDWRRVHRAAVKAAQRRLEALSEPGDSDDGWCDYARAAANLAVLTLCGSDCNEQHVMPVWLGTHPDEWGSGCDGETRFEFEKVLAAAGYPDAAAQWVTYLRAHHMID